MFTGIIDHCGTIVQMETLPNGLRLGIKHTFTELVLGESIAINGICLTVTQFDDAIFYCDLSPETLRITTANLFQVGTSVNLERALQLSSRLGGHFVMAHVDQIAYVQAIKRLDDFIEMTFKGLDSLAQRFIVKKGSIAINGVSLTINEVELDGFSVMLIPHTLERTTLAHLQENDAVNIEFDMLARMVVKQLENLNQ